MGLKEAGLRGSLRNVSVGAGMPDSDVLFDATQLTGFNDGDPVASWPDQIGNNDLTQPTGSLQPTYQSNVIGENPVVRFDGSDDYLNVAFGSELSQPNQIFIVANVRSVLEDSGSNFLFDGNASGSRNAIFFEDTSSSDAIFAGNVVTGSTATTGITLFSGVFNGANSTLRKNGTQSVSGDTGTQGLGGVALAVAGDAKTSNGAVDIGEIRIFDQELTTDERDAVESDLADKWGITI